MESQSSESSVIFEAVYDSSLSSGLDVAQYYFSNSVKGSSRQQVRVWSFYNNTPFRSRYTISPKIFQYGRVYDIWRSFCRENGVAEFGEDHKPLVACLSLVMIESGSYAKVEMLRAAIAHEYRIRMLSSPTTHETISVLFRGFRIAHPHERQARLPITEEILTKMCAQLYQTKHGRDGLLASVVLWRTIWRICLEYHTLGRFSDIVKLKRPDVIYKSSPSPHLKIIFKGGKNDQYSECSERIVATNPNSQFCPVKLAINYF